MVIPVFNLGVVLTKMRGLTGMPWHWILNKTIAEPVRLQNIPGKALEIAEGMTADLTTKLLCNNVKGLASKRGKTVYALSKSALLGQVPPDL